MVTESKIRGLDGRPRLRAYVAARLTRLLTRRRIVARSVRVEFHDDDGPRGGVAIRCALTVRVPGRPLIRVEHTARTHRAAFNRSVAILERQLRRRVTRQMRRLPA
jgi:ribosome-associated translation inhibitor RaiA